MADEQDQQLPPQQLEGVPQEQPVAQPSPGLFQQIAQSPVIQQAVESASKMLDFGGNLDAYNANLKAAMSGNPDAQLKLAEHSMGTAMGTVKSGPPGEMSVPNSGAAQRLTTEAAGLAPVKAGATLDTRLQSAYDTYKQLEAGGGNQKEINQAWRIYSNLLHQGGRKGFAEGGEVTAQTAPEADIVNMTTPDGQLVGVPSSYMQQALDTGHQMATPEAVAAYSHSEKYGSTGQQALTALEGAAEGATFGLSTGAETALGVKPEDIRGRKEENPLSHIAGQVGGLAASSLIPGVGEANILESAGAGAAKLAGLGAEGAGAFSKIGGGALKSAVETMMVQGGDEVSKMFASDPGQTAETAVADIGLAALLGTGVGGAFGAVSPLWKATSGGKLGGFLGAIRDKASGIEGIIPDAMEDAIQKTGMTVAPEIKASFSSIPEVTAKFQALQESGTKSGLSAQTALKEFKNEAANTVVQALGKTPEDIANLAHLSEFDAGTNIKKALVDSIQEQIEPIAKKFDDIKARFVTEEVPQLTKDKIAHEIGELAQKEGYNLSPSSAQAKEIARAIEEIPNVKNLEDLRKYQSILGDNTYAKPELRRVGGQLRSILRTAEEDTVMQAAGRGAPEAVLDHQVARDSYRKAMGTIESLNDRLHVGRYSGPTSFVKALKEMSPEDVLRRLSPKGDAGIIGELASKFPQTAEQLKDFHLSQVLKGAVARASAGEVVNPKTLFNALEKMSPEMRDFLVSPEGLSKIEAVETLLSHVPSRMNPSGTAKAADYLLSKTAGSGMGMLAAITGHNPVAGAILGYLGKLAARDVPDAINLAALKFLGSSQPIEAEGFKAMVDFIHHTIKGENLIGKSTKNLIKGAAEVLPQTQVPSSKDREKLNKTLKDLQVDTKPLFDVGGKTAHYLPDHGSALSQTAANATNYLNSLRPSVGKQNPFDTETQPSPQQQAKFDRALDIAQQPLVVLNHIKDGTLTPQDVTTLKTLYPSLYTKLSQKLTDQMMDGDKIAPVPYHTRLGLSMFLGQPLDSTMTPQSIVAAQPKPAQDQGGQQGGAPKAKHSMASLGKASAMAATPGQAREMARIKGKG